MQDLVTMMQAQIQRWEESDDDRAIFLTCYSMMTDNVLRAVADGGFANGPWVSSLTHRFAEYYFDALALYEEKGAPPVWDYTFETACSKRAHVLQNLLLGVNAHICYDLIFALVDSVETEWTDLCEDTRNLRYKDYSHINDIIGKTLDAVQDQVVESRSRAMILVDHAFGRLDEWMIHTLIKRWREQVWEQSIAYLAAPPEQRLQLKLTYTEQAEQRSRAIQGQRGLRGIIELF